MLVFKNLTRLQKRYVVNLLNFKDHVKDFPIITLKEEKEIYKLIKQDHLDRKTGEKVGFPIWMNEHNKVSKGKGIYQVPVPSEDELKEYFENEEFIKNINTREKNRVKVPARKTFLDNSRKNLKPKPDSTHEVLDEPFEEQPSIDELCREQGIDVNKFNDSYY